MRMEPDNVGTLYNVRIGVPCLQQIWVLLGYEFSRTGVRPEFVLVVRMQGSTTFLGILPLLRDILILPGLMNNLWDPSMFQ